MKNFFDELVKEAFEEKNKSVRENYFNIVVAKNLLNIYFNKYKGTGQYNKQLAELIFIAVSNTKRELLSNEEDAFSWLIQISIEKAPKNINILLNAIRHSEQKSALFNNLFKSLENIKLSAENLTYFFSVSSTLEDYQRLLVLTQHITPQQKPEFEKINLLGTMKFKQLDSSSYLLRVLDNINTPIEQIIEVFFTKNLALNNFNNLNLSTFEKITHGIDKNKLYQLLDNILCKQHYSNARDVNLYRNVYEFVYKNRKNSSMLKLFAQNIYSFIKQDSKLKVAFQLPVMQEPTHHVEWIISFLEGNKDKEKHPDSKYTTLISHLEKMSLSKEVNKKILREAPAKVHKI